VVIIVPILILTRKNKRFAYGAILVTGTLIIVAPWLIRNYTIYGEFNIVLRGGEAITERVLLNQMQEYEIKAAFYLWGPELYRSLAKSTSLDVDPNEFDLGGKYERIPRYPVMGNHAIRLGMPEKAIDYHSKVLAKQHMLEFKYMDIGYEGDKAWLLSHKEMKAESIQWILTHPIQHASMLPLFVWRSIWCFPNSTIPLLSSKLQEYTHNIVNLLSYLTIFILFIYGAIKRNKDMIALTLIPVIMLLFIVGVTHSLPRYTQPVIPTMLISLVHMFGVMTNHFLSQKMVRNSKTFITRFEGFTALISRS
jgi:hypothetical protein